MIAGFNVAQLSARHPLSPVGALGMPGWKWNGDVYGEQLLAELASPKS